MCNIQQVLELDADLRIVKKLKLVGNPSKISRHTAFVSGMFNSQLEASKFEGGCLLPGGNSAVLCVWDLSAPVLYDFVSSVGAA